MRRTIQGRRYDTANAVFIGEYGMHTTMLGTSEWAAGLYRQPRSDRYFLAGSGGMMTRWRGQDGIIPLTPKQARAWAMEYLGRKVVKVHFEEEAA